MIEKPVNKYDSYHAHVYFDEDTVDLASSICHQAGEIFKIKVGRVHRKPVGPHPCWSCQLAFDRNQFEEIIDWLDENRRSLNILIHGLTGDDLADHTVNASWLGHSVPLKLAMFRKSS